jgi:hypothetical protein
MKRFDESLSPSRQDRPVSNPKPLGVHVLSEHVFCHRASILARGTGEDEGDEEPSLGPRLDFFGDYDERRFKEALDAARGQARLWFTLLAPAVLLVLIVWRCTSVMWGVAAAAPVFYIVAQLWDAFRRIVTIIKEREIFRAVPASPVDLAPREAYWTNWWVLRKGGFNDCFKPVDAYGGPGDELKGKPWRILTKDTAIKVPVLRKHRGEKKWGRQHVVRVAAYCRLIESWEGAKAPFGVVMFAGTYECLVIPNDSTAKSLLARSSSEAREFLDIYDQGSFVPVAPTDNRCKGCPFGKPRRYVPSKTDTFLYGRQLAAKVAKDKNGKDYHSICGDFFGGVPPHERAIALGIAQENSNQVLADGER